MFLVIGATGTTGRAVLAGLAQQHHEVRALVRARSVSPRPEGTAVPGRGETAGLAGAEYPAGAEYLTGVEYLTGDAADPQSLRRAMAGAQKVFVAMGNGPNQEAIELGIVRAAAAADVEEIVKVSAPYVGPDVPVAVARMHDRVERAIATSGMAHTFLRPYAFLQNLLHQSPRIQATGSFAGTTGDAPMNLVDARDVAAVAVVALTRPASGGRVHALTGPEAVSYPEVARRMSALGQPVSYVDQTPAELAADLRHSGRPEWLVEHLLEIQAMSVAVPESPNDCVRQVTGKAPRTLDAFLEENVSAFQPRRAGGPAADAA